MFLWLTPYAATRRMAWVLIGCTSVWGVTSVFIEGFDCDTFPKQCPSSVSFGFLRSVNAARDAHGGFG